MRLGIAGEHRIPVFAQLAPAPGHGPPPDPLLPGVISLEYAVIAVSVLGVLAFSAEYSIGLIHVTFTAAPWLSITTLKSLNGSPTTANRARPSGVSNRPSA